MDFNSGEIKTIMWATGYSPDYSWLDVPVLDRKGRIRHDGGVVEAPGLYLMGIPFLLQAHLWRAADRTPGPRPQP